MIVGHVVRLEPDKDQESKFFQFAGTARWTWNQSKANYDTLLKEKNIFADECALKKAIRELRDNDPEYVWLKDVPEAVIKQAVKDLLKAYQKAYKERKKHAYDPKDPDKYYPKFKKKFRCKDSFYQRTDNIHKTDNSHIKITGIKKPVKCSSLKEVNLPERILNPRVTFDGKYWYLSYSYEIDDSDVVKDWSVDVLGIDLGIKDLAILSDGTHFANINKSPEVRRLRKRLKHLQRLFSRKYEANVTFDKNGKKIYHKTNNIKKLERQIKLIYRRIRNILTTYMYEVIKAVVRTKPQAITIEDLNVKGMLQNPHLARAVQEECFYRFRQILTYKCQLNGIELRLADRWYPSSKTCSCCGAVNHDLKLTGRTYICPICGFTYDRDENAAINLSRCTKYKRIAVA